MEKLVSPFLTKLSKEATGRYGNPALKQACDEAILLLPNLTTTCDDEVFPCLLLACTSKQPKYMVVALDCLEKLLAFGLIARKSAESQTKVIKTIGQCADMQDDAVQLQVVKALLTAVSTGVAHESNLLLALRACYHIHLVSDNAVNRTTAKISLTQMINYLFEKDRGHELVGPPTVTPFPPTPKATPTAPALQENERIQGMYSEVQASLGFTLEREQQEEEAAVQEEEQVPAGQAAPIVIPAPAPHNNGQQLEFTSVSFKDAFLVLRTLSKLSMKAISFEDMNLSEDAADEEDRRADPRALKSKLLSLELLSQAISTGTGMLKQSDALLFAIKHYLFPALMKNCMEVNIQVASLAVKIFEQLLVEFKTIKLKKEMENLISGVFLSGLLDSPHASFESRQLICECVNRICQNLHLLAELFLNYDCDLNSKGLLRSLVESLHRVSMIHSSQPEAKKLAKQAVTCLASLAKSLTTADQPAATSAHESVSNGDVDVDIVQEVKSASVQALTTFQQKQMYEKELNQGVQIFNQDKKPMKAIAYWRDKKLIDASSAKAVAQFLLTNSNILSKTQIGEVLGGDAEENKEILSAYVSLFDFANLQIDLAIRQFLSHFRLPGEAQKVDRVFENFASRYWEANKTEFPNADCAFVLSFAIIMLQTDAHNPNIKPEKKMKKQDFLKNNRGIASGRDMSAEFLGGIYDRITATAITMKGEDLDYKQNAAEQLQDDVDARGKRRAFFRQREEILRTVAVGGAKQAQPVAGGEDQVYYQVESATVEHITPMFTLVWQPMRESFLGNFLSTDDPATATVCLEGVFNCIRCAARLQLSDERDTLLEGLAQLTKLHKPTEIQPKNVMCIQALVTLAVSEANYLGSGWFKILQCVSELSRLLAMNANGQDDSDYESSAAIGKVRPEMKAVMMLKRVMDISTIDRIFLGSETLTETAVVDFVHALTLVSRAELGLDTGMNKSRVFSLQKLVEVSDVNLAARGRVCWSKMWAILGDHFVVSGCHPSVKVALYAVDSLKQLSLKFLNREEFVGFNFQDAFLRPFEQIEQKCTSSEVRALVLSCMQLFVVSKSKMIKSGWGAVFDVIAASALLDDSNARFGFSILELCQKYGAPKHLFAMCALKFARTKHLDLCTKCFAFVEANCGTAAYVEDEPRLVFVALQDFAFSDQRVEIQRSAFNVVLTTFRNAMEDRASPQVFLDLFREFLLQWKQLDTYESLDYVTEETTRLVCGVVFDQQQHEPAVAAAAALEDIAHHVAQQSKREAVYLPVLQSWLEFVQANLLSSQVLVCVKTGVHTLDLLLRNVGAAFSVHAWGALLDAVATALQNNSPALLSSQELLEEFRLLGGEDDVERGKVALDEIDEEAGGVVMSSRRGSSDSTRTTIVAAAPTTTFNPVKARARATAHLGLVKLLCKLRVSELGERLAALLEQALVESSQFNDYHALRVELASRRFCFPHDSGMPDALEVEVTSALTLLRFWRANEARFERVVELLLGRYLRQDRILAAEATLYVRGQSDTVGASKSTGSEKELAALTPVVLLALRSVLDLEKPEAVKRTLKWAFPLMLELIECPNRDVRAVVKKVLEKHVTPRLQL